VVGGLMVVSDGMRNLGMVVVGAIHSPLL